eukprot:scaffold92021_cov27-Tisochrysis_lutea.AAC.1
MPASIPWAAKMHAPIVPMATCAPAPGVDPASIWRRCSSACSAAAAAASFLKRRVLASSTYWSLATLRTGAREEGAIDSGRREGGKRSPLSRSTLVSSSLRSASRSLPPRAAGMREATVPPPTEVRHGGMGDAVSKPGSQLTCCRRRSCGSEGSCGGTALGSGATPCRLAALRRRARALAVEPAAR